MMTFPDWFFLEIKKGNHRIPKIRAMYVYARHVGINYEDPETK
jgi:hypothetical protein